MEKEIRKTIAKYSEQIDALEKTRDLILTSNVLCFTTMDRSAEETVSIEFEDPSPDTNKKYTNHIVSTAKKEMVAYIDEKIGELNEKIDKILGKEN